MRSITYVGIFYKGGEYLFDSTIFAGYNGVMTGTRKGAYSVSINERKPTWRQDLLSLAKNMLSLFAGYQQNTKLIRDVLTECKNYDCAYQRLSDTPVIGPSYFIIAGLETNEGAVITRDRFSVANVDKLTDDKWYVL